MKLIYALNSINSQVWAFLVVITGCLAVLSFHKEGVDVGIAAGVIGAGVNMFTASLRAQQPGAHIQIDSNPDPIQPEDPPAITKK